VTSSLPPLQGEYHTKGDGSRYYHCPVCRGKYKLEVHHTRPVWYCHKCGIGGRIRQGDAKWWGGLDRQIIPGSEGVQRDDGDFLSDYAMESPGSRPWNYLSRIRHLKAEEIRDLRPHRGPSPLRVYFPLYRLGETVPCYFVGRAIISLDRFPKWMNPPTGVTGVRRCDLFWGTHLLGPRVRGLAICEGIFDAVRFETSLALLGKSINHEQVSTIARISPETITVILDGDASKEATEVCLRLKNIAPVYRLVLPLTKDPDSMKPSTLRKLMKRKERIA
jgi:hypothetical protein